MENQNTNFNKENVSSFITNEVPTHFNIPDEAKSLFNESIPKISETVLNIKREKYGFYIKELTDTLNLFNITLNKFLDFLSQNPNLDFPQTEYEKLKTKAWYQLLTTIQESADLTTEKKISEINKLWQIADEADSKKRDADFKAMAKNYGIKLFAFAAGAAVITQSLKSIIKTVNNPHTKTALSKAAKGIGKIFKIR